MDEVNRLFTEVSTLTELRDSISVVKTQIINDQRLSEDASFRLLSSIDIFDNTLSYGIGQGITDLQDLDGDIILSMPCGVAVACYAAAFIGICAATGGVAVVAAAVGFGGSVWGVFDSC